MTDKQFNLFMRIFNQMNVEKTTYADGIIIANAIIFTIWKQMGAQPDLIDKIISSVEEPLRKAMQEYLNNNNQ